MPPTIALISPVRLSIASSGALDERLLLERAGRRPGRQVHRGQLRLHEIADTHEFRGGLAPRPGEALAID
jgi:hypothetical protein